MMTWDEFCEILKEIAYKPNFKVEPVSMIGWLEDDRAPRVYVALRVGSLRLDSTNDHAAMGWSDPYPMLCEGLTEQRVVFKAFAAFRDYEEHEAREFFEYEDIKVVGPHPNLHMLMRIHEGEFNVQA